MASASSSGREIGSSVPDSDRWPSRKRGLSIAAKTGDARVRILEDMRRLQVFFSGAEPRLLVRMRVRSPERSISMVGGMAGNGVRDGEGEWRLLMWRMGY